LSYLVRPIEFEDKAPEISAICLKCSDLAGVEICENEFGIFVSEIPNEIVNISKDKRKITLSGFYESSPFVVELVTNYLESIGGKIPAEKKSLNLPTTIEDIQKYNENIRKDFKKAYPVIWALIIIFVLVVVSVVGGMFFGLFKLFF